MLELTNVRKTYKSGEYKVIAVDNVSFSVPSGKFASIIGKSGSGKSTLLSLMGALDSPSSGKIIIDGQNLTALRDHKLIQYRCRTVGFVFQNYNLIPNLTAIENVTLPMEFAGVPKTRRKLRSEKLLKQVGLSVDQMERKPGKLSGGQQQRVAIARALANKPKIILADEPTGNLDSEMGKMIFDLLHDLSRSENTTIIVVTHDQDIAGKTDMTFRMQDGKLKEQ